MLKNRKIFISATYKDLKNERLSAMVSVYRSGNIAYGMELFPSSSGTVAEIIGKQIEDCDLYLLIIGNRYGSIHPESGKSFTEWEYDLALKKNKRILSFIKKDSQKIQDSFHQKKYDAFISKITANHTPSYFSDLNNFKDCIWASLDNDDDVTVIIDPLYRIVIQALNEIHPSFLYDYITSRSGYDPYRNPDELEREIDTKHTFWDYWEKYLITNQYTRDGFEKVVKSIAEHGFSGEEEYTRVIHIQSLFDLWRIFYSLEIIDKNYIPTKLGEKIGELNSQVMIDHKRSQK